MLPRLIGIVGKARSGKTTVAEYLRDKYDYTIISCADPLKQLCVEALKNNPPPRIDAIVLTPGAWHTSVYTHRTPFTRWLLQFVGTDIGRALDQNIWVDKLREVISQQVLTHAVVVPDVRFQNEASCILAMGGNIWRTLRTDNGEVVEHGADHASEREQENIEADFTIEVPSGVAQVHAGVDWKAQDMSGRLGKYSCGEIHGKESTD